MQLRALGRSGLSVSPICLGTMTFGIPVEEPEAIRLVHGAMDLGINFIDTANVYEGYARFLGSAGGDESGSSYWARASGSRFVIGACLKRAGK